MTKRDLEGRAASLADVERVLGPQAMWEHASEEIAAHNTETRAAVGVAADDVRHLAEHPPYVSQNLLHCARHVLEAPRAAFEGLRSHGIAGGCALAGRPVWTYDNAGARTPAPAGMVYLVYIADGTVFDWDWVRADPAEPSVPLGHRTRFARRAAALPPSRTLGAVELPARNAFDPSRGVYSAPGDCVFAYFSPEPSYAERINDDLTLFRAIGGGKLVGCKVKNITAILSRLGSDEVFHTGTRDVAVKVVVAQSFANEVGRDPDEPVMAAYEPLLNEIERTLIKPRFRLPEAVAHA